MKVAEQIEQFVRKWLDSGNSVQLDGEEINDIHIDKVELISDLCERIEFTVIFTNTDDTPPPFFKLKPDILKS